MFHSISCCFTMGGTNVRSNKIKSQGSENKTSDLCHIRQESCSRCDGVKSGWNCNCDAGGIDAVRTSQVGMAFKTGMPNNFQEQLTKALAERLWDGGSRKSVSKDPVKGDSVPDSVVPEYLQQMLVMVRSLVRERMKRFALRGSIEIVPLDRKSVV